MKTEELKEKLKNLSYEEGETFLIANGYYKSDENDEENLTDFSERISDIYFTSETDEDSVFSYVIYYNLVDDEMKIVAQRWEEVE